MILASTTIGSILFLLLTTIFYSQILHALKHDGITLKIGTFVFGSTLLLKAILPNVLVLFQLWSASKFIDSPNLTLAKEVALQYGLIILFQLCISLIASLAGYIIPLKENEAWAISPKVIIIGVFMITAAYLGSPLLFEMGKTAIGTNAVGFH